MNGESIDIDKFKASLIRFLIEFETFALEELTINFSN